MGGSSGDGPARGGLINPGRASMGLAGQSLIEALDVIEGLLKAGEHEGPCTDIENFRPCAQHMQVYYTRIERAKDFLARFERPGEPPLTSDEELGII